MSTDSKIEQLLAQVEKPGRYVGGEVGTAPVRKHVRVRVALVFPEVYEIGMSHLGLKVLYDILARREDVGVERVFCPWVDMMGLMAARGLAPWSLEARRPLGEFDLIGFSLTYELTYTNMLKMLLLAGIPLRAAERNQSHPVVVAGGPCMFNPEPVAEFLDLVVIGDGEEVIGEIVELVARAREGRWSRRRLWEEASGIEGVYVPALYQPRYDAGRFVGLEPLGGAPKKIKRRVVRDLGAWRPPLEGPVPLVRPVHERLGIEIARGCTRGCRFCQAGFIYRPVRERPPDQVLEVSIEGLRATGAGELGLLALSASDYGCIEQLACSLMEFMAPQSLSLSLPSLRLDSVGPALVEQLRQVRKGGFTIAPEAGTERLRRVINKDFTCEQVLETARTVYSMGWGLVKLYFMVGLPTETPEDVEAIAELAAQVAECGRASRRKAVVHASVGVFVPKAHTPFQWEAQLGPEQARQVLMQATEALRRTRAVRPKWNDPYQSVVEGLLSRGDRRMGRVIEAVARAGRGFDGWSEHLEFGLWLRELEQAGLTLEQCLAPRDPQAPLPWDHIDTGVSRKFLLLERARAMRAEPTGDCRWGECVGCGVCDFTELKPVVYAPTALAPPPAPTPPQGQSRLRLRLAKRGRMRWVGHLELMAQLEAAVRRAGLWVEYTRGFHPHPLIKTAGALPLGAESVVELVEITLKGTGYDPAEVARAINAQLPQGIRLYAHRVPEARGLGEPREVTYHVLAGVELPDQAIKRFERLEACTYTRATPKGEVKVDLKGSVKELRIVGPVVVMRFARTRGPMPRAWEVVEAVFGLEPARARALRAIKVAASWNEG